MGGTIPPFLEIERRWFYRGHAVPGGVLVEGHANLPPGEAVPQIEASTYEGSIRDLESRHLGKLTCHTYTWNEKNFKYEPSPGKDPCKATPP
jgi:hypothetical protein